jgi:aminoglycoside phosphotransferase family enzyme/predicted kinase
MDPARIEQLRDPAIYPEGAESVEILQTHLSVVVLSGDRGYKFKKAIHLPFADFTSLEQRRFFCEEELRLNRRLCPEIYESVVALRADDEGRLRIGDTGAIVDFAVKMRRLPQNLMMDVLLEQNAVGRGQIEAIALQVVAFHRESTRGPEVDSWGDPEKLRGFAIANFAETRGFFPERLHAALESRTERDFARLLPVLKSRVAAGHVVDGHGDLHARNICLIDSPAIYDCIEFNPGFRCGDVATEHAFLVMDLRFRGHSELADAYLETVLRESGDEEMKDVLPMLVRYRAMVRAKVSAILSGETELPDDERAESSQTASRYLRVAAASAIEDDGPWWLIFCGLPASGKSSVAEALSEVSGRAWPVLSSDRLRKELAGVAPTEPLPESFYSDEFSHRTYAELLERVKDATASRAVVILDANFRERRERSLAREAAKAAGARLVILRVDADEAIVIERLASRKNDPTSVSDADRAVYEKLKARYEVPQEEEADQLIPVNGDLEPGAAVDGILAALLEP